MEEQIAKDIQKALDELGPGEFVEISITPFIHSWANGRMSISDKEISQGLIRFAKTYSMDYIWILVDGEPMHNMLRFWKKSDPIKELEITIMGEEPKEN
jgi:hypothetical protein